MRGAIEAAAKRIIGFEMQFGPFAVAQLRLIAELQALMGKPPLPELRLFITDTLGNPFIEEEGSDRPMSRSQCPARRQQSQERPSLSRSSSAIRLIRKSGGTGRLDREGRRTEHVAPLDRWTPPPEWGVGAHAQAPKNLTFIFGAGRPGKYLARVMTATGKPDEDRGRRCLFHHGRRLPQRPRFPEDAGRFAAHARNLGDRLFPGGTSAGSADTHFSRRPAAGLHRACRARSEQRSDAPASSLSRRCRKGGAKRNSQHSRSCHSCPRIGPIVRERLARSIFAGRKGAWATFPSLERFFIYDRPGVMPGRTWIIAPDANR